MSPGLYRRDALTDASEIFFWCLMSNVSFCLGTEFSLHPFTTAFGRMRVTFQE